MPYQWSDNDDGSVRLQLWPYRSLPKRGFVLVIGLLAGLLTLPLLALLGSALLWGLLPFLLLTVAGVWWGLASSYRSAEVLEDLRIAPAEIVLNRRDPGAPPRHWHADPYWVNVEIHSDAGPVPSYLTLTGGPRRVELGAFLTPDERQRLHGELCVALAKARTAALPGG